MAKLKINNRFGVVPNELLNNSSITFKAKWLFGYLQSKPDDRDFSAKRMAHDTKDWIDAIYSGLKELEDFGYLKRLKYQDDNWHWDIIYNLFDTPNMENPSTENPGQENPGTENPGTNKKWNTNKEESKKEIILSSSALYAKDSFNYRVCKEFLDAHKKAGSMSVQIMLRDKAEEQILQEWADEVRKFLHLDNYTEDQIEKLFKFTYTKQQWLDEKEFLFWQRNLQSIMKFRSKNKNNVRYFEVFIDLMKHNKAAVLAYYNVANPDLIDEWI